MTPPDYNQLLDPEVQAFIAKTNACYPEDTEQRSIAEQRAIYNEMCDVFRVAVDPALAVRDDTISGVPVRIYGEIEGGEGRTQIVYAHGGGFVVGGLESHHDVCAEIAIATGLPVISVDYLLSPEHPHPAAFEDMRTVAEWALDQGEVLLAGDSAGGNLAAAVSGALRGRIKGQVLIYPALGGDPNAGSYLTHAEAPLLTRDAVLFYEDIRQGAPDDPSLRPLLGPFEGLPPTVCFPAECDPLFDDGVHYVQALKVAGVTAKLSAGQGLVHGHLRARHMAARAGACFAEICAALGALAHDGPPA